MTSISDAIADMTGRGPTSSTDAAAAGQTPFAGLIKNAIGSVQNLENQAATAVEGLMTGQGVDVHQAMIATQKADMSFEMALAVRSKAVAAYQQVMQMQF
ncbi:MAG: flagellar hook-basal body complex protein FliE [Acidobacteriaceae bacterium]